MKHIILFLAAALTLSACGQGSQTAMLESQTDENMVTEDAEIDSDSSVLTPEQEEQFNIDSIISMKALRFAQTKWQECTEEITGNYYGYNCSQNRNISVILKSFIDKHFYTCVDEGLKATGGGVVNELHIVHAGITGDPNHSPRSLHAENRAIDVKSLQMKLTNGKTKNLVYEGTTNRTFYTAFRTCWGKIVRQYNGCPMYQSNLLTGSIGWENADHKRHLHVSVPYCVGGKYAGNYYYK